MTNYISNWTFSIFLNPMEKVSWPNSIVFKSYIKIQLISIQFKFNSFQLNLILNFKISCSNSNKIYKLMKSTPFILYCRFNNSNISIIQIAIYLNFNLNWILNILNNHLYLNKVITTFNSLVHSFYIKNYHLSNL